MEISLNKVHYNPEWPQQISENFTRHLIEKTAICSFGVKSGRLSNYAPVPVLSLAVPVLSLLVPVLSLVVPVLSLAVPVLSLGIPVLSLAAPLFPLCYRLLWTK